MDSNATPDTTTKIDTVLFDLDGTLVEYERSPGEVLEIAFERAGFDPFFEVEAYFDRFDDHLGPGVSIDEGRANCFAEIAADSGRDPEEGRAVADAFAAARDQSRVRALPGAREALDALADDFALGLVTNGPPEMQTAKLAAAGLGDHFETVVFAGHDAAAKPDPEPFEVALDALGSDPDRAIHVGDSLGSDVTGAHAAGLRSAWVQANDGSTPGPEPDYDFASVGELRNRPW
ncbi:HAD family hydrolase [Halorussus amylolyticus]|uniref:HAD family hydrolase n=1 Tax=Halorussus amylolyticus TaxID=1126242 RepID=UPI00104E993B|nr:HAD family hydrolase [Halorussus amylolyticus]